MITIDSKFYRVLEEEHRKPFDWNTNNCGQFVGRVYSRLTGRDYLSGLSGDYNDSLSAFRFVKEHGGWDAILTERGLIKRDSLNTIARGDVVICEEALGLWDGTKACFAGGSHREYSKLTSAYYLGEET